MILIGRDIEFLPGVEDFNSYVECGMRATIVDIQPYPEDGLFEITLDYRKFEVWNFQFESMRFTHRSRVLSFRDAFGYCEEETYCVSDHFDLFKPLDALETIKIVLN
jgi:hypothetical protein